jgi:hypothetical protein
MQDNKTTHEELLSDALEEDSALGRLDPTPTSMLLAREIGGFTSPKGL